MGKLQKCYLDRANNENKNIFDIAGRAMAAQMVRPNTISSNLASGPGDPETVYKPLKPNLKHNIAKV